jgi:hypothetical protein
LAVLVPTAKAAEVSGSSAFPTADSDIAGFKSGATETESVEK